MLSAKFETLSGNEYTFTVVKNSEITKLLKKLFSNGSIYVKSSSFTDELFEITCDEFIDRIAKDTYLTYTSKKSIPNTLEICASLCVISEKLNMYGVVINLENEKVHTFTVSSTPIVNFSGSHKKILKLLN